MAFNVVEIGCLFDTGYLIQLFHITVEINVIRDTFLITFKMSDINGIKTDQRGKQAPIGFSNTVTSKVAAFR